MQLKKYEPCLNSKHRYSSNRIGMLIGIGVLIKKQNKNQIRMLNPIIRVVIMLTQM